MTFELGVYTFGNTPRNSDGTFRHTAEAIRNALEAIKLADDVGLSVFGLGEHHTLGQPLSSPISLINAAAASTKHIKLVSAVTVLPTDDPIRVYQQHATAAAIAPGRVEIVAGRGSSTITFDLFGYQEKDYESLFSSKLDLLIAANSNERVTWNGPHRGRPLTDALIVPRTEQ